MALDERIEQSQPAGRWLGALAWPLVVLIGLLLFELTAQPAVAVIALCLKFGWNDLRTAWWLRRRDSRRGRGWACFFLYISSALWKITLSGFLLLLALFVVLAVVFVIGGKKVQPPDALANQLSAALLTGLIGASLAMPLSWVAVFLALVSRSKLWLDGQVNRARREDCWPPSDGPANRGNRAGLLILSALIMVWFVSLTATFFVLLFAFEKAGQANSPLLMTGCWIASFGLNIFALYKFQNYFERMLLARSPSECWGNDPPGADTPGSPWDIV
jgi:hypothetical protein